MRKYPVIKCIICIHGSYNLYTQPVSSTAVHWTSGNEDQLIQPSIFGSSRWCWCLSTAETDHMGIVGFLGFPQQTTTFSPTGSSLSWWQFFWLGTSIPWIFRRSTVQGSSPSPSNAQRQDNSQRQEHAKPIYNIKLTRIYIHYNLILYIRGPKCMIKSYLIRRNQCESILFLHFLII